MRHLGDITKINGAEIEPVDVITFGSPCQDLSIAGKRMGLAGKRSGLYIEAVRVISEMYSSTKGEYPKFVVFENVFGMLSSNNGEDFVAALDMMTEIGFIPDPQIHDAQYCGVPQRRRRIGIVWANIHYLLSKRTIISDSIMLQCLTEILLIDWVEACARLGIAPKKSECRAKWLSEDGLQKRIKLFSLQKEETIKRWQRFLDEVEASCPKEQENLGSRVGEIQMDLFAQMTEDTSTSSKIAEGSISIGACLRNVLDAHSLLQSEFTTSTATSEITTHRICTCFQTLLRTLNVTGAYLNCAMETNPDAPNFFGWAKSVLTVIRGYMNEGSANGKSLAQLVGHDILRAWNVQLSNSRISVVADFGGSTAHEILFEPCGVSGNFAESGTSRERPARAVEGGTSYAVRIRGGCEGGGKGALVQREKSGTLGTGNDQTLFCMATQQGGAEVRGDDKAPTLTAAAGMSGNNQPVISFTQNQRDEVRDLKGKAGSLSAQPGMKQQTYILDGRAKAAAQAAVIPIHDKATRYEGGGDTRKNDGAGNGLGVGRDGDPAPTLTSADKHIVAAFKSGQGAKAGGIGYEEEVSPTLSAVSSGTNQVPAIFDMSHANDVIRECGEVVPRLQARMGTGGNQVPLTYAFQSSSALSESDVAPTQSARQYKSPTDLVYAVDCRNFTENGNVNGTLQAKESGGSSLNLNNVCRKSNVVRRLTPLECTRLQGFPDRWVDIGEWADEKGRVHKEEDAPKYKALGNSIALPFWKWLLRRISEYLPEGATLGSLFDGIAGFPLCWAEIHGAENCRWASEIEPFPIAVVKRHFGDEDAGVVGDLDEFLRGSVVR